MHVRPFVHVMIHVANCSLLVCVYWVIHIIIVPPLSNHQAERLIVVHYSPLTRASTHTLRCYMRSSLFVLLCIHTIYGFVAGLVHFATPFYIHFFSFFHSGAHCGGGPPSHLPSVPTPPNMPPLVAMQMKIFPLVFSGLFKILLLSHKAYIIIFGIQFMCCSRCNVLYTKQYYIIQHILLLYNSREGEMNGASSNMTMLCICICIT